MGFKLVRITEEIVKFTIIDDLDDETISYIDKFIIRNLEILEKVTIDMKPVKTIGMPGYRCLKTNWELLEDCEIGFELMNLSSKTKRYIMTWEKSGFLSIPGRGNLLDTFRTRQRRIKPIEE
ncbi:MAG: hypothetical protein RR945_07455 [Erysipelotrichaceae bacterium]